MKFASFTLLALLLAPAVAAAQPSSAPPPPPSPGGYYAQPGYRPGGFFDREGHLSLGFGFGLGFMSSDTGAISCDNCDYEPITFSADFHVGGMLSPRLALLAEFQVNGQTVEDHYPDGAATLGQGALMVAGQFWLTPRFWLKGGLGFAGLSITHSDYYEDSSENIANGTALLLGAGYEFYARQDFSVDLQGRLFVGSYDSLEDHITSGTIGLGFNFF